MNTLLDTGTVTSLAEQIVARLTVELEASGRHIHLSRAHVEALFGPNYQLNRLRGICGTVY